MFSLKVEGTFSSAHNLRGYKGKCEDLHGHNWRVEITVKSGELDDLGMVLDFKYLKNKLNAVLEEMDHKYLNKLAFFSAAKRGGSAKFATKNGESAKHFGGNSGGKKINPTSENIAKYIYNKLKTQIPLLDRVTVWENSTSAATYEE